MRQPVRLVALCVLLLLLSFQAEAQPTFRFVKQGKRLYLSDGKQRLLWISYDQKINKGYDNGEKQLKNESALDFLGSDISIVKSGKPIQQISLNAQYTNGAGRYNLFLDAVQSYGNGFIAILNWQDVGGSGGPVVSQQLVQIKVKPKLAISEITTLPALPFSSPYDNLPPRLFRNGTDLLLYSVPDPEDYNRTAGELLHLAPNGKIGKVFAKLPPFARPQGVINNRWLVGINYKGRQGSIWALDLKTKRIRSLLTQNGLNGELVVPQIGTHVLFNGRKNDKGEARDDSIVISPQKGIVQTFSQHDGTIDIWNGYIMMRSAANEGSERENVVIYSIKTGKELQRLKITSILYVD